MIAVAMFREFSSMDLLGISLVVSWVSLGIWIACLYMRISSLGEVIGRHRVFTEDIEAEHAEVMRLRGVIKDERDQWARDQSNLEEELETTRKFGIAKEFIAADLEKKLKEIESEWESLKETAEERDGLAELYSNTLNEKKGLEKRVGEAMLRIKALEESLEDERSKKRPLLDDLKKMSDELNETIAKLEPGSKPLVVDGIRKLW